MCKLSLTKKNISASCLLALIKQKKDNVLIIFVNSNKNQWACYILSCSNDAIYSQSLIIIITISVFTIFCPAIMIQSTQNL